jgi:N-acetylglucosaminyldiphosphoundecaprenol N-acetyl-beta-D-mannosaminyltransferase
VDPDRRSGIADATTRLAGLAFPHVDLEGATRALLSPEGRATAVPWRLVNTFNISLVRSDPEYAATMRGEGINLPDGKPVGWVLGWLSRRAGFTTAPTQVRGPALFCRALDEGRADDVTHYLLGGSPETLTALVEAIERRWPGARVVGAESPPFRDLTEEEQEAQDQRIRASGADLVWVGLGTPRQDGEAARLARSVKRPAIGIGAAFDFVAGTRAEAPVWVQRLALEWLFRFASEPRRLWRRYTIGIAGFLLAVLAGEPKDGATPRAAAAAAGSAAPRR